MSITLMAYPMAFLISPEQAKGEKIHSAGDNITLNKSIATQNLRSIRVLTNIEYTELTSFMSNIVCNKVNPMLYSFSNGIKLEWNNYGKYMIAELSGDVSPEILQADGEKFFSDIDRIASRNVRLVDSGEYFYYNYSTSYTKIPEVYKILKEQGAKEIFSTSEDEVVANLNGQSIKYYKKNNEDTFTLEVEQKVSIVNIGLNGDFEGTNVTYGLTNMKIQTNIKPEELKTLLKKSNYLLLNGNMQTPLKNSNATLNWILNNGYYTAEFSGSNNAAIIKEAEIIFRKMNIAAGRDLRSINDVTTSVYTYKTNYTDKGTLINTLTEHGAEDIVEEHGEISCKLFGMEMIYYQNDGSQGYTLDITQVSNTSECQDLINDLNEEYGLNIQEMTYNKIKERLDKENMRLESEAVMEDNSIVLTIDI